MTPTTQRVQEYRVPSREESFCEMSDDFRWRVKPTDDSKQFKKESPIPKKKRLSTSIARDWPPKPNL
eukprot:CAMPEP_0176015540 /NCGR_PEP_ID=MMETSP0120_2-20121206/7391_1 /TAXON_ID=160619 /ORGANISM="Kryptoperidinium foliaceum, Strain CCMP 1326" /LENGTH=66 /DNA_ID=CAMNT_0017348515 /DNA_START=945 /DNA_END=1142 /DNA_ORIENTATION=-